MPTNSVYRNDLHAWLSAPASDAIPISAETSMEYFSSQKLFPLNFEFLLCFDLFVCAADSAKVPASSLEANQFRHCEVWWEKNGGHCGQYLQIVIQSVFFKLSSRGGTFDARSMNLFMCIILSKLFGICMFKVCTIKITTVGTNTNTF